MRVRYTDPAANDFEESLSYLRAHAPTVVTEFADAVDQAVTELLHNPYSAQETEKRGIRRKYIRKFKHSIFYTVEEDEIVILHIRHAARRWPFEFGDDTD
jgi:toxin ParE1/3/4